MNNERNLLTANLRLGSPDPLGAMAATGGAESSSPHAAPQEAPIKHSQPDPAGTSAGPAVAAPYGYLWFNLHMERRFTHRLPHPQSHEQPIGDVVPVYIAPINAAPQAPAVTGNAQPEQPAVAAPIACQHWWKRSGLRLRCAFCGKKKP